MYLAQILLCCISYCKNELLPSGKSSLWSHLKMLIVFFSSKEPKVSSVMTWQVQVKCFCHIPKTRYPRKIICMNWTTPSCMEYKLHWKEWMTLEDLFNLAKQCITYKKSYSSIRDSIWKKGLGTIYCSK